jgi:hypothetical protein
MPLHPHGEERGLARSMTKVLAGKTSRAATDLRAESSNREQVGAISSKCEGVRRRAEPRNRQRQAHYPTCAVRSIVAQPASMNVAAPGGADAIADKSFGTSGLRSASRFVFA